jgi:hypothetical protein
MAIVIHFGISDDSTLVCNESHLCVCDVHEVVCVVYELPFMEQRASESNFCCYICLGEPVSSVSIVSIYGLDGRAIGVRSPTDAKRFFL